MTYSGVFICLLLVYSGIISGADQSSEQDSLVQKLTAVCGKDGIKVSVRFSHPFKGIVYSDGHYDTPHCIFVDQENKTSRTAVPETRFSFLIPADACGTKFHDPGSALSSQNDDGTAPDEPANELGNEVYMENTVMFQKSHFIQEQGDLAQTLRCVWQKEIRKPLHATLPLTIRSKQKSKFTQESKEEKFKYEKTPPSPPSFTTAPFTKNVPKEFSYLTSAQQRHADIRKKFQAKGQVESVSYGGVSRRTGKSLAFRTPIIRNPLESSNDVYMYRNPSNFTALPFKAEDASGATARATCNFVWLSPQILSLLMLLNLSRTFCQNCF